MLTVVLDSCKTVVKAKCSNIARELPHPGDRSKKIRSTSASACAGKCPGCQKHGPKVIYVLEDNDLDATHAVDCPTCCCFVFFTPAHDNL